MQDIIVYTLAFILLIIVAYIYIQIVGGTVYILEEIKYWIIRRFKK